MLLASVLPWLNEPLEGTYSAWQLPVDIGWQFHTYFITYGLLCLLCAAFAFFVAYANWKPLSRGSDFFEDKGTIAGFFCLVPIVLFIHQYIFADLVTMEHLSQHQIQLLFIQNYFGYDFPTKYVILDPLTFDSSTILNRSLLLLDQVSGGVLLPFVSAFLLFGYTRFSVHHPSAPNSKKHNGHLSRVVLVLALFCLIVLGRAPAAIACEDIAKTSLSSGDYVGALNWLQAALFLNPTLDQVDYFHVQRGEALYYLHPYQQSLDSLAYLASVYSQRKDRLDAFKQLQEVWHENHNASWVVNEMDGALELQAQASLPLSGDPIQEPKNDDATLPWLQQLILVDPSNVYAHYLLGSVQYDLENYPACTEQMLQVIQINANADVLSSAYTYIGLSYAGQGDVVKERMYLEKAVTLDTHYFNNTAREELSGLR